MGRDAIVDKLQPSLRDSIMLRDVLGLASWAKFSRPYGTYERDVGHPGFVAKI
jgi:hypothetical protein